MVMVMMMTMMTTMPWGFEKPQGLGAFMCIWIYIYIHNIVYHIASNMSAQNMICMMCIWSAYNVHICIYCIISHHIISYHIILYYIILYIHMYYDTVHLDHTQRPKDIPCPEAMWAGKRKSSISWWFNYWFLGNFDCHCINHYQLIYSKKSM